MTRFYKRATRLTVWRPRPSPVSPVGAFFEAAIPNAVQVDGLRVQFSISKSLGSDPNTCEIIVTNLAERTRAEFQDEPRKVILEVGFDGELMHLFSGDVSWAASVKNGSDWETALQVRDGGRGYSNARVNRSYDRGTAAITAIRECAAAFGLSLPPAVDRRPELQKQFAAGVVLAGKASDELSRLLAPFNLGWSFQDGQLQILAAGDVRAGQAIVIEEGSGMIGSPSFQAPASSRGKKAKRGTGSGPVLSVDTLLYPQIAPGGIVEVRGRNIHSQWKVRKVDHQGDSWGEARTSIEAIEHGT